MAPAAPDTIEAISRWLLRQVEQARAEGLVLGLQGDVNSSVVAALARRALEGRVSALIMPCGEDLRQTEDALLVARTLKIDHQCINLEPTIRLLKQQLPASSPGLHDALIARLRMAVLYHHAQARRLLVSGSLNRSDWEIGRFTPHGDTAADLQPIRHLLAEQVFALARHLELPQSILHGPLAGVREPEPGEDLPPGLGYPELDAFLSGRTNGITEPMIERLRRLQAHAAHRRRPPLTFQEPSSPGPAPEDEIEQTDYDKSIEALTLISEAITSDQYLEDILRLIVMVTAEVMNSSVCSLWLLDEKEQVLRLRATQSITKEYLKDRVLRPGEGIVGKVVMENEPYSILDVLQDPYFKEKELAAKMGLVSMLSMPMRVKDRVIGVINCYTSHPHAFTELQVNVLTTVANQAAVAIENTELMVKTKVILEELESRKVIERAKDLIMERSQISGKEAYQWLRKRSMDSRKSMRQVAEAVLLTLGA